jgi:hypothetical protein
MTKHIKYYTSISSVGLTWTRQPAFGTFYARTFELTLRPYAPVDRPSIANPPAESSNVVWPPRRTDQVLTVYNSKGTIESGKMRYDRDKQDIGVEIV